MVLVSGRLEGRDLGTAVSEITATLQSTKLPVGYTWEVGGQYLAQRQAFRELLQVLAIASALVFVILVVHFREFGVPILILAAAPLSLGGALLALIVTGTELNVSSAMGLVLLIGLVVKNGIVLLDYADHERARGVPAREAVFDAARVRLRPILMTTLCTLFGLVPLALGLGAGAELQRPLALAVIGGLTLSTLITLYLIPALYAGPVRRSSARRRNHEWLTSPNGRSICALFRSAGTTADSSSKCTSLRVPGRLPSALPVGVGTVWRCSRQRQRPGTRADARLLADGHDCAAVGCRPWKTPR